MSQPHEHRTHTHTPPTSARLSPIQKFLVSKSLSVTSLAVSRRLRKKARMSCTFWLSIWASTPPLPCNPTLGHAGPRAQASPFCSSRRPPWPRTSKVCAGQAVLSHPCPLKPPPFFSLPTSPLAWEGFHLLCPKYIGIACQH